MKAADLLDRCKSLGIDLAAGPAGALVWESDADPPAGLLEALVQHKAGLLSLLDRRPVFAVLPSGRVEKFVGVDQLPSEAIWWCHEGDKQWTLYWQQGDADE
jgi:hypothetical protein